MNYTDGMAALLSASAAWLFIIVAAIAILVLTGEWFSDWISD